MIFTAQRLKMALKPFQVTLHHLWKIILQLTKQSQLNSRSPSCFFSRPLIYHKIFIIT